MPSEVSQTPTKELCLGEMSVRDRNDTKSQGFPFGQGTITEINHYSLEELETGRQKTRQRNKKKLASKSSKRREEGENSDHLNEYRPGEARGTELHRLRAR